MSKYYLCLDIGGTKVLGAIFDEDLNIVYRIKKKTKVSEGFQNVEDTIVMVVQELLNEFGISATDVLAIAAGAPGVINNDTGVVLFSPNLPWKNYNIGKVIGNKFNTPFFIGNDANLGVLGEWKFGVAKGLKNVVGIFIGTGIGGGLILDGKLFTGNDYKGAEIGHIILNTEGPICNCGQRGCLEAFSSKTGMKEYISLFVRHGRASKMEEAISEGVFKSKALKAAYEAGDPVTVEAIDRACLYLAVASGNLVNIFSPEMILYGGGVMEAMGDVFHKKIVRNVDSYCLGSIRDTVRFTVAALGDDSVLYGALALIIEKLKISGLE